MSAGEGVRWENKNEPVFPIVLYSFIRDLYSSDNYDIATWRPKQNVSEFQSILFNVYYTLLLRRIRARIICVALVEDDSRVYGRAGKPEGPAPPNLTGTTRDSPVVCCAGTRSIIYFDCLLLLFITRYYKTLKTVADNYDATDPRAIAETAEYVFKRGNNH